MFVNSEVAQNMKAEQLKAEEQQKLKDQQRKDMEDSHPDSSMPSAYNTGKDFAKKKKSAMKVNNTEDSEVEEKSDEEKEVDNTKELIEGEEEKEGEAEGENKEEKSVSDDSVFKIPFTLEEIREDIEVEREKLENRYEQLIPLDEYIPMATLKTLDLFIKQYNSEDRTIF